MIRRIVSQDRNSRYTRFFACAGWLVCSAVAHAQVAQPPETASTTLQQLQQSILAVEAQLKASQQQLVLLQQQVAALQAAQAAHGTAPEYEASSPALDIAEQQAMQTSQIATLNQAKVESDSKYPVKLSGLILLNSFMNTGGVDEAAAPTAALAGNGTTALSLRQSILGVDARGPHFAGAESHADLHVDFFGASLSGGYNNGGGLVRLRTAHASLQWKHTEAFFQMDRTLLNPNVPSSLASIAQPALAWSGNLWSWNPQVGISHTLGDRTRFRMQAAWIDALDPSVAESSANTSTLPRPALSERGRYPGVEARIALLGASDTQGLQIGVGGYYSQHSTPRGRTFDAWASTLDLRTPLWRHAELTGSLYRGQGLGGLGVGGYKDYVSRIVNNVIEVNAPADVGGWIQLKQRFTQRLEWNTALGMDNVYAKDLRPYSSPTSDMYSSIARNRTLYSNLIFSPSAYLLFTVEYRRLSTWPVSGTPWNANVVGLAAGYRF